MLQRFRYYNNNYYYYILLFTPQPGQNVKTSRLITTNFVQHAITTNNTIRRHKHELHSHPIRFIPLFTNLENSEKVKKYLYKTKKGENSKKKTGERVDTGI